MKVLLVNGSPHKEGCTYTALTEVEKSLNKEGIETDIFWIGNKPISGCIACKACVKLKKCVFNNDKVNDYEKHIVDNNDNQEKFECEIIKTNYRLEFKEFIDTLIYFDELDKAGLYEGYSDKEIAELGIKIYMCENTSLPCEITWNENNYHYELKYTEHSNDYYFGYIPEEYNKEISKIINSKEIIHGGMRFKYGYFKEYDFEKDKVIKGYDEIKVFINLLYK